MPPCGMLTRGSFPLTPCCRPFTAAYSLERDCQESGLSTTADDWRCDDCPVGKFTAEVNLAPQCTLKTTQEGCGHLVLKHSGSLDRDNTCHAKGRCKPGQQVAENGIDCDPCESGKFNREYTQDKTACQEKPLPTRCDAGHYLDLGVSKERNDWRCARCPVGQFRSEPFDTVTLTNLDADIPRCAKKVHALLTTDCPFCLLVVVKSVLWFELVTFIVLPEVHVLNTCLVLHTSLNVFFGGVWPKHC